MPRKSPAKSAALPRLSPADYAAEVATAPKTAPAAPPVTRDAPTSVTCPTCGKPMKLRHGKWGQFYGCTGFPTCKQTLNPSKVHGALLTNPSSSSENPKGKAPAAPWTAPKGSEEQEAIWAEIVSGKTHMMVEAYAGCLAGDTMLQVNRGGNSRKMTLEWVVKRFNGVPLKHGEGKGWTNRIPTMIARAVNGVATLGKVKSVWFSGIKITYTLKTVAGRTIRATGTHPFLTTQGWKQLRYLKPGMNLLVEVGQQGTSKQPKPYYKTLGTKFHPNQTNRGHKTQFSVPLHRAVVEADMNGISIEEFREIVFNDEKRAKRLKYLPKTAVVHHKNENTTDNRLENLEVLIDKKQHSDRHEWGNNVLYKIGTEEIESITLYGEEPTYDIEMEDEPHNFLASGFVVHNSGKSFTCRHGMHFAKQANPKLRIAYFAFSREIVAEFRHDAPEGVYVGTLNAAGYGTCKRALKCGDPNPDKVGDIVEELLGPGTKWAELRAIKAGTEALVSLCMGNLLEGTPNDLDALSAKYDVSIESTHRTKIYDLVPRVLLLCQERTTIVSYDDQIWLPVVLGLPCPKYDLIFTDETQDLNACQHELVKRMINKGGRVIAVGDVNQSIFGFRGSDVDSMANFAKLLCEDGDEMSKFTLSVTRRCPKSVVREAQAYVPGIKALDDAPEGTVRSAAYDKALADLSAGDMVLCRVNAPLVSIAYKLLREKRKAVIRGRDIGGQLLALINRLDAPNVPTLIQKAYDWHSKESAKLDSRKKNSEAQQQALSDKLACLLAICEGADNLSEVKQTVETLFANFDASGRPKDAVILSSIHRAKGLEAARVFWYDPSIRCRANQEWQQRQERNLCYTSITRAKAELVYMNPSTK